MDLTARIKPKKSSTTGEVPQASDLEVAELAVNTADGKLFVKHTDDSIKEISGGGASNIVDQGDYSPRYNSGAPEWNLSTTAAAGGDLALTGEGALVTPFYIELLLRAVDANGIDRTAAIDGLLLNDVLTFSWNGGANTLQKTITQAPVWIATNDGYYSIRVDNSTETWSDGELVQITGGTLTANPIEIAKSTGDLLTWNGVTSKFEPTPHAVPALGGLTDVDTTPIVASPAQLYNTYDSSWTGITQGEWGGNGISQVSLYIHRLDANGDEFEPLAANGNGKTVQIRFQTSGTDYGWVTYVVNVSTISGDIKQMDMVSPSTHPQPPGNYTSVEVRALAPAPATDGQVLTYVAANSQWESADLQGAAVRAALGIGEYVDDAAAGTGGVASGAMYYNTTSSDYRLKS